MLQLTLLTPFTIRLDHQPLKVPTRRTEALLIYLIRNRQTHARDVLAQLFWDDLPQTKAQGNLRVLLANLRKTLPRHFTITRQSVAFNPASAHAIDMDALEQQLAVARQEIDRSGALRSTTAADLGQALLTYQGDLLPGFFLRGGQGFEEWLATEREWLWTRVVEALDDLATEHLQNGDYRAGIEQAQRLVNLDPLREEGHQLLMQLWAADQQLTAALAQYERCVELLDRELGVPPHAFTTELWTRIRAGKWQPPRVTKTANGETAGTTVETSAAMPSVVHNLPRPLTPFWGRKAELAHLATLLGDTTTPLITLVGPGGIGKTALALEAARQWVQTAPSPTSAASPFADGLHLVRLGTISAGTEIAPVVAAAVGYHFQPEGGDEVTQLAHHLRDKAMLLLLDNAEHLLEQSDFFSRILAAPRLQLLVTSRHRLNLRGENVVALDGLDYPNAETLAALNDAADLHTRLMDFSAIRLFVEQARRTHGHVLLHAAEMHGVARICQLVQGMPLAILLAAARVELFSPAEIAAEIERDVTFLATEATGAGADYPARQHSMRAVFHHSWALLTPGEQQLLARMSIFPSGCTRPVAQAVTGGTLRDLLSLVHKSLLVRDSASERFTIHELLRQMAAAQLDARGEPAAPLHQLVIAAIERLYADHLPPHYGELAHHAEQAGLLDTARRYLRLAGDAARDGYQNERALELYGRALQLTPAQETAFALRLERQALFHRLGRRAEQAAELDALDALAVALHDTRKASEVLINRSRHAEALGRYPEAAAAAQRAVAQAERAGAADLQALGNLAWGVALGRESSFDAARARLEEAVHLAETAARPVIAADSLRNLAIDAVYQGQYDLARRYFEQNLAIYRALDNPAGVAAGLGNLGALALHQCDYRGAHPFLEESVARFRQSGDRRSEAIGLNNLGMVAHKLGDYGEAKQCIEQALRIATAIDDQQTCREAHNLLGHLCSDQAQSDAARAHYTEALRLARMLESGGHVLESQVGLAAVALAAGDAASANVLLGGAWEDIDEALLAQTEDVVRLYWSLYRILDANHAAQAGAMLATACRHLQRQAAQITDLEMRKAFLHNNPIHRAMSAMCGEFEQ